MALRQCSSAHCSGADAEINEVCKAAGWPVNHPVLTRDDTGPCICSCSCLAFDTPVQADDTTFRAIQDYQIGDSVLAAGKDLKWNPAKVNFSQGTTGASRQKYTVLIVYGDTFLAVTSDHIFLLYDGTLKPAAHLSPDDQLTAADGSAVPIESLHIGDYTAGFHHIATTKAQPDENLSGHLLNTNGVVSGDYSLQLFYRADEINSFMAASLPTSPVIGSPEYVQKYGDSCLKLPSGRAAGFSAAYNARDVAKGLFIPAEKVRLEVPDYACRFIPDDEAKRKAAEPRRAWNDPLSREWTEYLIAHHRAFYPDVTYHLDWADDTVNAYAWVQNGVRHVAILGGLVRHLALEMEGIGLVLAHELAHHYGGAPTGTSGLSCEGQADYAGVRDVMRKVWFGEYFITFTDAAIDQMANFFGVPNDPTVPGGSAGCSHPAGACRIATYHAAVTLSGKPACAE